MPDRATNIFPVGTFPYAAGYGSGRRMTSLRIIWDAARSTLTVSGSLGVHQVAEAMATLRALPLPEGGIGTIDLSQLQTLDTAGALLLTQWAGEQTRILPANEAQQQTLTMTADLHVMPPAMPQRGAFLPAQIAALGKWAVYIGEEARALFTFTGKSVTLMTRALLQPRRLRLPEIAHHIDQIGIRAMPIIGLISFLIAVVLAYQSVAQLRPYGGEQFTVDLIALSILREMGVLLTAIMVAGRSGSAFTAEIGVMKAREEVDALKVMGFDPFDMLVIPRLVAICLALPLLTFFADMMGLLGGFIISHVLIDISYTHYLERVHYAIDGYDLMVGIVKAPVFAFFIGIVGCMHGLRVSGSAESIGRETTAAVVKSIFLVLVLDACFSIFFQKVGL